MVDICGNRHQGRMTRERSVNEFCVAECGLGQKHRVTTAPTEAGDTDFSVGFQGPEFGEEGFDDGDCDGLTVVVEPWSNAHKRFRKFETSNQSPFSKGRDTLYSIS